MRKKHRDRIGPRMREIADANDMSDGELVARIMIDQLTPGDLLGGEITYGIGYYLLQGLRLLFPLAVAAIFIGAAITDRDWGVLLMGLIVGGWITVFCLTNFRADRKETAEWIEKRRFAQQKLLFNLNESE